MSFERANVFGSYFDARLGVREICIKTRATRHGPIRWGTLGFGWSWQVEAGVGLAVFGSAETSDQVHCCGRELGKRR